LGELGGRTPPPPANATPAPTDSTTTATAAGAVDRSRRRDDVVPLGLKRSFSLSPACGVSCRARAERAALRTRAKSDSPPGRCSTPPLWFPRSHAAGPRGFGRSFGRAQYSHACGRCPARQTLGEGLSRGLDYHPPAVPVRAARASGQGERVVGAAFRGQRADDDPPR
jgi:hypothetical protein